MSARKATPGLLKIKGLFWKRLRRHNFSPWRHKKMLSRDSIYNVNLGTWPKFGNSVISVIEVIITSVLYRFDQKNRFLWRVVLVLVQ